MAGRRRNARRRCNDGGRRRGRGRRRHRGRRRLAGTLHHRRGQRRGRARRFGARIHCRLGRRHRRGLGQRGSGCRRVAGDRLACWRFTRPFDHQHRTAADGLHLRLERHHLAAQVEDDAQGARHRMPGPHRAHHAAAGRQLQALGSGGIGKIDDQAVGVGQRQRAEATAALQTDLGAGAGGAVVERDRLHLSGKRHLRRQAPACGSGETGEKTGPRAHNAIQTSPGVKGKRFSLNNP